MSKAEDRALKKYPQKIEWVGNQWDGAPFDVNSEKRFYYQQGYKEAEKDLALTWEDICYIVKTYSKIECDKNYKWVSFSEACKETLNRFNKYKER